MKRLVSSLLRAKGESLETDRFLPRSGL